MWNKTPENPRDSQENKLMVHETILLGVLTWDKMTMFILLWTHYTKTQLYGKGTNYGNGGRTEKKMTTSSKVEELSYSGHDCTIGRCERIGEEQIIYQCGYESWKQLDNNLIVIKQYYGLFGLLHITAYIARKIHSSHRKEWISNCYLWKREVEQQHQGNFPIATLLVYCLGWIPCQSFTKYFSPDSIFLNHFKVKLAWPYERNNSNEKGCLCLHFQYIICPSI